jgi:uncharacterized membrane protein
VDKFLVMSMQILTIVGVLFLLTHRKGPFDKVKDDYVLFGLIGVIMLLAGFAVPGVSNSLYFGRWFGLTLLLLCGFLVVGIYSILNSFGTIFKGLTKRLPRRKADLSKAAIWIGTGFVIVMLIFETGVIYSFTSEYNTNNSLDSNVSWAIYSDSDVSSAKWINVAQHEGQYTPIADWHRFPIFGALGGNGVNDMAYQMNNSNTNEFIYLSNWNVQTGYVYPLNADGKLTYSSLADVLRQVNNTYDVVYSSSGKTTIIYIPTLTQPITTNEPGPPIYYYNDYSVLYFVAIVGAILMGLAMSSTIVSWARRRKGKNDEHETEQ